MPSSRKKDKTKSPPGKILARKDPRHPANKRKSKTPEKPKDDGPSPSKKPKVVTTPEVSVSKDAGPSPSKKTNVVTTPTTPEVSKNAGPSPSKKPNVVTTPEVSKDAGLSPSNKPKVVSDGSDSSPSSKKHRWTRCRAPSLTTDGPPKSKAIYAQIEEMLKTIKEDDCGSLTKALHGELVHRIARFYSFNWKREKFEVHHLSRDFNIASAVKSAIDTVMPLKVRNTLIFAEIQEKVKPILMKAFKIPADCFKPGSKEWLTQKRQLKDYTVQDVVKYPQIRHQWIAAVIRELIDPKTGKPKLRKGIIIHNSVTMFAYTLSQ